ncbi:PREDICTED: endoplasmic reticulum-Golgi intermediate compartment protein 3-like [Priapulus caudatus]|uniref:Endoplasmic reticulum-Golgi intermediate compartment protein 3 n=1 Tax=Priapulus caudatus TaxID=37621 RepID=A0ABM1F439_PRICU|nr:PREDICTED: endoplasmic reticulum-Golgi intermediate compartment protein 3-like [Priapulus caudatus]
MQAKDILQKLRRFDAYPKTLEDFRVKTFGGAAVTVISGILMVILFVSELNYYLTTEVHADLFVDTSRGQKLRINMDVTFPRVSCAFLSIDAMDVTGETQIDVDHNIYKERLDLQGNPMEDPEKEVIGDKSEDIIESLKLTLNTSRCESCYGAETYNGQCCNTCEEVREAYRKKGWAFITPAEIEQCKREGFTEKLEKQQNEGCHLYGYLEVNKVAGNFHIAPGKSFQQHHVHVHDLQAFSGTKFNMTHSIKHFSFGQDYPGLQNPLDHLEVVAHKDQMMFQYFVKIVPTTYLNLDEKVLYTNQYSITTNSKVVSATSGDQGLPGMFMMYELSPMMVKYTEQKRSFFHFLTGVCAIIGGVFTVAGLVDAFIFHSAKMIQKKIDLGKAS